jgi:nanoRNase/pAp phosphatase (c-di-AMP/oligoRNAs hydrolase)
MDLTPKQQTSEAIRQAETILILTGQHPSIDQATSVVALAAILRKFGKTVTAVISDNPPTPVAILDASSLERNVGGQRDFVLKLDVSKVEVDKLRYEVEEGKLNIYLTPFKGSFAPSDVTFGYGESNINYDLTIVLGVPTRARIDRLYEQNSASFENIPLVNLDFHRSNESYGAVNLIEPNASSLCEMLVALSESLQSGIIDADIATSLLMGIVASTDRFTAAHTSPKSLTVAAQMMAAGARQQAVVKALYRDNKSENRSGERQSNDRQNSSERNERTSRNDRPERSVATAPARPQPELTRQDAQTASVRAVPNPAAAQLVVPVQPAPAAALAPASYDDLPIIQPGHIELSEPEPYKTPAETLQVEQHPQAIPLADFAAAAEMFNRPDPNSEQEAS